MIKPNKPCLFIRVVLLAFVSVWAAGVVNAEDVVPAREQSDEKISVWAKNASLEVFVSQLAAMTGRRTAIQEGLEATVSGRFNGSMVDTLNTVSEQHQMLFDLDQSVLGVVAESERSSATIPLNGSVIEDVLQASLSSDQLMGNEIQLREGEVVVSGHPEFVKRVARLVTTSVADAGQKAGVELAVEDSLIGEQPADQAAALSAKPAANATSERVIDAAADVMIEQAADESLSDNSNESAAASPRAFRWVTDIPGFETF